MKIKIIVEKTPKKENVEKIKRTPLKELARAKALKTLNKVTEKLENKDEEM